VVLESAKDQILGVDILRQHVSPRIRYEMTCLIIRNAIGWVSYSVKWGMPSYFITYFVNRLNDMVQEGTFVWETLTLQAGTICSENCSKA
jgi:hypothetical protein